MLAYALLVTLCSEDMGLEAAKALVVKVMSKSLDSTTLSAEKRKFSHRAAAPSARIVALLPARSGSERAKCFAYAVEFATVTRSPEGEVLYSVIDAAVIDKLIAETDLGVDEDA